MDGKDKAYGGGERARSSPASSGQNDQRPSNLIHRSPAPRPMIDRAQGIYIWDTRGNRYVDASSGPLTCTIGHRNERVFAAMAGQAARVSFAYPYQFENEAAEAYARDLAAQLPPPLDRVFFVSGGSEAVEACLKMARQHAIARGEPTRWKVISVVPSYHGSTLGALAVTGDSTGTELFRPMMVEMPKIPAPTCAHCPYGLTSPTCAIACAERLEQEIRREGPETVLAFIIEPVGGAATGALTAPEAFFHRVREICDAHGVLLIYDEVMCGVGRTGKFLAGEHFGVAPDLVALAKGLGAGYIPLGALVTSAALLETIQATGWYSHGHTYACSPLASAVGRAVLAEIVEGDLVRQAERLGEKLREGLLKLRHDFSLIGDIRGKGLMQAFELTADRTTGAPLPAALGAYQRLVDIAFANGLMIYARRPPAHFDGRQQNDFFLIAPPLTVSDDQIAEILALLRRSLSQFEREYASGLKRA
jgi:adenosylmethionine-8-amino-7-oxononanoate aminotransferase